MGWRYTGADEGKLGVLTLQSSPSHRVLPAHEPAGRGPVGDQHQAVLKPPPPSLPHLGKKASSTSCSSTRVTMPRGTGRPRLGALGPGFLASTLTSTSLCPLTNGCTLPLCPPVFLSLCLSVPISACVSLFLSLSSLLSRVWISAWSLFPMSLCLCLDLCLCCSVSGPSL